MADRPTIGLFAAASSPADATALAALLPKDAPLILFEEAPWPAHPGIAVTSDIMVQMVAEAMDTPASGPSILPLGDADAAEMLDLATLTRPGPFLPQTHRLGGFVGIRQDGRLAAMAGTRLRVPGYVEVSGVCTHPQHRGRGHGARLMRTVGQAILESGNQPFLHAFASNTPAIALYERLGFHIRRRLTMSMLTRAAPAA